MTVTRRLLIHITLGAALVIAVVAVVTYMLVFDAAEKRMREHLQTYATERTKRQEAGFKLIYANLEVVRSIFIKRDELPVPANAQAEWNRLVERYPDRAWRSRLTLADPRKNATVWARPEMDLSPKSLHRMLIAQRLVEELMPLWVETFPSLYIMFPGAACIGFNPLQPEWEWDTPADYPLEEQEWYRAATPEFNPSRGFVWTGVYPDPISGILFATVLLPIENGTEYLCTIGHDLPLSQLLEDVTHSDFHGATHVLFQRDGRLIMHPALREAIAASEGELSMLSAGDPALSSLYREVTARSEPQQTGYEPVSDSYYSVSLVPGAEWYFLTLMPRSLAREQALQSAHWVWVSGLASLGLLLASSSFILKRQIGRPLAELARATKAMSDGDLQTRARVSRADDFGALAGSFNEMVSRVAERETELRQLNIDLEKRVEARTDDLHQALLHERELGEMKSNFVSLVSHEFRTPLGVIMSATDVLQRYFERLPVEKRARHLDMIFRSTRNLANLIEEVLLLGRVEEGRIQFTAEALDLEKFCRSILDESVSATNGACPIFFQAETSLAGAASDESLLRHILSNLLSNAVKYSNPGTAVHVSAARAGGNVVFTIRDQGIGISAEDQARLFTSFVRGRNVGNRPGTGLGLVVVQRCVRLHGGSINIQSAPGQGTTVSVTLPVFPSAANADAASHL